MSLETLDINLVITVGAVILALLASLFAFRGAGQGESAGKNWKLKCAEMDRQIGRLSLIHI